MAGKIPVHGKMRHCGLSGNTLTGLLLQHIPVENPASRFSFSGLLRGKLLLLPNRCRGLLQHIRRKEHVSAVQEIQIFAPRRSDCLIHPIINSTVLLPNQTDSSICGKPIQTSIRGTGILDDYFIIRKGLPQDTPDRLLKAESRIIARCNDTEKRCIHSASVAASHACRRSPVQLVKQKALIRQNLDGIPVCGPKKQCKKHQSRRNHQNGQ